VRHGRLVLAMLGAVLAAAATLASAATDPDALAARHGFAPAHVGFLLFDAASGRVLEQHRADEPFIPASTTKVTTALAALEILGTDFRFATTLLASGPIENGTLHGDLYLRGGGDPTLSSDDLRGLAGALRRSGIRRIDGRFLFDESLYPRSGEIDLLQPEAASYNPAVSALSVNYNRLEVRWKKADGSRDPEARLLSPADGGALPVRGIATGVLEPGLDPRIEFVFSTTPAPRWLLSPRLAPSGSTILPVKGDPGPVAAELFATLAADQGIALPAPERGAAPGGAREVARHESAPLTVVAEGLLRYSNNLTAELTGLAASQRLAGTGLALEPSARRLAAWWQDRLPDTSFGGFVAANHSGLSSTTRHSPRQLAAILRYGVAAGAAPVHLPSLLPSRDLPGGAAAPGGDGGPPGVRAKSGTLLYADGLAGFLVTRGGRELGFVILLSDHDARARLDATRDVRLTASPPEATDWTARAKALERDLLARWAAD
jgi:D-alanyl-D-alanine carboxypeptidase/D-alanyl-D-alanine-endopeptidase (penicillin-binding protein 4)